MALPSVSSVLSPAAAEPREGEAGAGPAADGVVRPRRAAPAEAARSTRAEINLAHVRHNLHELQAILRECAGDAPPAQVWAVLKADGYGHGARAIGMTLERAGVDGVCVALLEEGIELRQAGVRCPILVMGGYYGRFRDGIEALIAHGLIPVVYSADQVAAVAATLRYLDESKGLPVHVKIDTGMSRLGVSNGQLHTVLEALRAAPQLRLEGLMTQLACADAESLDVTREQLEHFAQAERIVRKFGFSPSLRHAANSAALLRWPGSHLEIVRPGIAIFGVHPCASRSSHALRIPKLKPVMRVSSEVVTLRDLPVGAHVGYGYKWEAARPSRIATIPMGYADGLNRALARGGEVLVCGRRAPIVGEVSMDLTTVDVTDVPGVSVRDEVVLLGPQKGRLGSDAITAEELAARTDSIPYEVLTSISRRVPRFYRQS